MASAVTFSGLASGIDSSAIISALTNAAKAPIDKLNAQKTNFTTQSKKLTDIKTKLTALQTAAKALNSRSDALGNKATSSDDKILKVEGTGGAAIGASKILVKSLAQAQRNYSAALASSTEAGLAGTGNLSIQVGTGDPVNVEISGTDTLNDVAYKINASGAGVSAGVIKEGNNYRLQVTGKNMGAANVVTFAEDASLSLGLAGSTPQREAKDAAVEIDGFTVTSDTNVVTNAVPGAKLTLMAEGTATVSLDTNPDDLKSKLNTFVSAYNDVMKSLNSEFATTGTAAASSLRGDSTMRSLQSSLRSALQNVASNGSSKITMLTSMGVNSNRDGTLAFDDAAFKKAAASDYEGVATALAGMTDGTGLMSKINDAIDPFTATGGTIKNRIDALATRSRNIDSQVGSMQTRLDKYETGLQAQYAALEQTISKLQSQGTSLSTVISSL